MKLQRLVPLVLLLAGSAAAADPQISQPGAQEAGNQIPPSLFTAIRSGDAKALRAQLRRGAPVNACDDTSATLLMYAALYAGADCVKLLLDRGADPNATNKAGATALMWGVRDFPIVRSLLENGADVHLRSAMGNTALNIAAYYPNSKRVVEALLQKGADVHTENSQGMTPLIAASIGGDVETLKLLIARGAKVNFRPAALEGLARRNALESAVTFGHLDCVRVLLDHGAEVNAVGPLGPALSNAAFMDRFDIAQALLNHGADFNVPAPARRDTGGETPLIFASMTERDDPRLVKLLLSKGADVHARDRHGNSAFAWAKKRGHTTIVDALLKAGAKVEEAAATTAEYSNARTKSEAARHDAQEIRAAVTKAVNLGLGSGAVFTEKTTCFSCHQQSLPGMAAALARRRGIAFDEKTAREEALSVIGHMETSRESTLQVNLGVRTPSVPGYGLLGLEGIELPPQRVIDALVHRIAAEQSENGSWSRPSARPPLMYSDVTDTALALRTLKRFPLPGRQREFDSRIRRGTAWLRQVRPNSTEERAFQLLGLAWAETKPSPLKKLATALLAQQRADGGWSQLPTLESDAYATGQALYALHIAGGLPVSHPAYRRGVRFLRETQQPDGSWFVRTRTFPLQKHFETGFPHGKDQWISAAGTSWAAMALILTEEPTKFASRSPQPELAGSLP